MDKALTVLGEYRLRHPTSHCACPHISLDGVKSTPYLATIEFFTVRLWQRRGRDTARLWTGQLLAQRQVLEAEVSLPAEEKREKPKEVKERGKNVEIGRYPGFRNCSGPHLPAVGCSTGVKPLASALNDVGGVSTSTT